MYNQQEKQWQIQKKRNNNSQQAPRGNTSQTEQSTKQIGTIAIPTQNTYINLDVQETPSTLETMDKHTGSKSDRRHQIELQQQQEQSEQKRNAAKSTGKNSIKGKEVITGPASIGIDLMLPSPAPLDNIVNIVENVVEEAVGGMARRIQETPTKLQEGVTKGKGELPHVEDEFNNKSGGRLSKKKDAIKKKQTADQASDRGIQTEEQDVNKDKFDRPPQDDYGVLNFKDEVDSDNQSIDESGDEEEDNSNQPPHNFGSTFKEKWPKEVQELSSKQGLSPRGRKQNRQNNRQTTSTSETSSRPNTRSKSKGF
ncbi:uncharacterized protein [Solanum tuberosum]|uniref:uncharacterized protein n=1 Tax=Solanum tuberosum TaxID=4113 RepID=UPI00073A2D49|nr:PREDICTED: uncharacterized protein LOC107057900 [Solanum tuberosum]